MATTVLGRERELAAIARVFDDRPTGPVAVLIEGDAGIGKTTLWQAVLELARARSWLVLAARAAEAEAHFSYGTIRDLLAPVLAETIDVLPGPQRHAVEAALLRAEGRTSAHAVSAGVLGILRAASAERPVLVGIDDLQWLDVASARVLEFALRRMSAERVGVLAAARPPGTGPVPLRLERALGGQPQPTVVLGPMPAGELHRLVHDRLGTWLPRPVLRRVVAASGGNPFFALEMARALIRRGMPASTGPLPVPGTLGELVQDRLAPLSPGARAALQVVSAAPRAPAALVDATAGGDGQLIAGLAEAEDAGIVARDDSGVLEFTHPLLATVVYAHIQPAKRRALHRAIAAALAGPVHGVKADPAARARHLALGADGPDEDVAQALEAAAASERSAGAPESAAELADLARRLTPLGQDRHRRQRTIVLAQHLFEAGDTAAARSVLATLVAEMAPGANRARVLLRLALVLYAAEGPPIARACALQAVTEAEADLPLLAEAHAIVAKLSDDANLEREAHAQQALELLGRQPGPDPKMLASALLALAMARYYTGRGVSRPLLDRAIELEAGLAERPAVSWRAKTVLGEFLKYTDDFAGARVLLEAAHREAADEGDEGSLPDILGHLAELELWAGNWERAARYAEECVQAAEQTGQELMVGVNLYCRGLVNAHLGLADAARADAEAALEWGQRRDDPWGIGISLWVLGFLELSLGQPAETSRHLSRAWQIGDSIGLTEPGQWRFHPDHLEALIGLGDLDRAEELLAQFEKRATSTGRAWALATAARCRALLLAARGDVDAALAAVEEALAHHEQVPVPFELARTKLTQGQLQRRSKHKRAARDSLEQAVQIFEHLGAPLWASRARAELARIGLRPPAPLALTATEDRVAELVAAGHTNREVAQALFMSVHTVEDNLRRIYRKLGIRSRTELAAQRPGLASQHPRR